MKGALEDISSKHVNIKAKKQNEKICLLSPDVIFLRNDDRNLKSKFLLVEPRYNELWSDVEILFNVIGVPYIRIYQERVENKENQVRSLLLFRKFCNRKTGISSFYIVIKKSLIHLVSFLHQHFSFLSHLLNYLFLFKEIAILELLNSSNTQILKSLRRYVVVTGVLVIFIGVVIDVLEVLILPQYLVGANGIQVRSGESWVSIGEFFYTKAG